MRKANGGGEGGVECYHVPDESRLNYDICLHMEISSLPSIINPTA